MGNGAVRAAWLRAGAGGLALGLVLLAGAAQAADAADQGIVVTGAGLAPPPATPAYDTLTLDRAAITQDPSGRTEDALLSVAGFQQFRRSDSRAANPSAQGVTLRALGGNATSRTLVLLDGVPIADPMFGAVPFSDLPASRLGKITVMRGGGTGAFGAGAVAGTIAIDSADAATLGLFSGEAAVDNRGEGSLDATLAPKLGNGFATLSGNWEKGAGYYTTPASQRVPVSAKSAYESWSAALRTVSPIAPGIELQTRLAAFQDNRTLRFAGATSLSRGQDASVRLVGRGAWQFDALAYVQNRDFGALTMSSQSNQAALLADRQASTPATGIGAKLELRPPVGAGQVLRLGSDWRRTFGNLWEDAYVPATGALKSVRHAGGRTDDIGFFLEDDLKLGRLTLSAGGRADRWVISDGYANLANPAGAITASCTTCATRADWAATGRAGAVWQPVAGLALRASVYNGLRLPTVNELYRTFIVGNVTTQANPGLVPERLTGYEGGIDFTPAPWLRLSATAFENRVAHAIANVTVSADGNTRQRQNVDAIRARGLEFAAHAAAGRLTLDGALALTDAVVEQAAGGAYALNGKRPAQTPKIAASATLGWRPTDRLSLAGTLRHVGMAYEDDLNSATSVLPAATTLGAYAQWRVRGALALVVRAENLTDATVYTRNQGGSIDLGQPRTVWFAVKLGGR